MRFAVIGKGFIYPRHEQAIKAVGGKIIMTCDIDPEKHADFTDWVEMFNDPQFQEVDAVVICTPNYLHGVIAREAQLRGKKVLCEKPLVIDDINNLGDTKTVLQLRKHPKLKDLEKGDMYIEAKMFRDDVYWNGWKGKHVKSGGILYNLGVHYLDLMVYLLGDKYTVKCANVTASRAVGLIDFDGYQGQFHIEIVDSKDKQGRLMSMGGEEIVLSNQENLSYEDLHIEVYKDFLKDEGISVEEAHKSLKLIKDIESWKE